MGTHWGGRIHSREARWGASPLLFPGYVLPDGPPNTRGPLEVLVGLFTDVSDFLGRLLVMVEFYPRDYLFTWLHVFVSDDVLRRN